tara:strand:+ start:3544 stop:3726 length:183 start_codon:yes stop_codon:yes gene_type:complete
MSYQIYDKFRAKVISTYETEAELKKALQHFSSEDDRYEIVEDKPKRKPTKKAKVNEEKGD